jgi:hypothetical protein
MFIFQFHPEHGVGQRFQNDCHYFNRVFFTHAPLKIAISYQLFLAY